MPTDALPQPWPAPAPAPVGLHSYRHVYLDALRRPMTGRVRITPQSATTADGTTYSAAPATAQLVDGVLDVELPPGRHGLLASLRTVDGDETVEENSISLPS